MQTTFLSSTQTAIALALGANIFFGLSCIVFAKFTEKFGQLWVNLLKAVVSTLCFFILVISFQGFDVIVWDSSKYYFILSGMFGLALADFFLLSSLRHNGVAETLIFYSFQPFLIYTGAHFFWGESLAPSQWGGVVIFCLCLFLFCLDKYQISKVQLKFAAMALVAILLDTSGVLLSKAGYMLDPNLNSILVCFYRGVGAMMVIGIATVISPTQFWGKWSKIALKDKSMILAACFAGTFLSLLFYLKAVQIGPLTIITAVSVATPLWATFFEYFAHKKKPSKIFILCFSLYLCAFTWNFLHPRA